MLMWLLQLIYSGAVLSARHERQRSGRMSIYWLTRRVKMLIISRAGELSRVRLRRPRRSFSYRGCRNVLKPGLVNAFIGVRLRRMLHAKCLIERLVALAHALRHIDDYAAIVAKRMRRGLTRRFLHLFANGVTLSLSKGDVTHHR
jgi:hypothetical protein